MDKAIEEGIKLAKSKTKQYIYIVQALLEPSKCKIGKTNDLERRLKEYNSMTGKSKENIYQFLFSCEVKNMAEVENAIKAAFSTLREEKSKEIYFYNSFLFNDYVKFIKSHTLFMKEIFIKTEKKKEEIKIIKKSKPSLKERGVLENVNMKKAQKIKNDEFYTRYEDIEKELPLYDRRIWLNKTVFCNCDDAVGGNENRTSAFALYFINNFKALGLKKLICTHYVSNVDLFYEGPKGYIFTKFGYREIDCKKEYPDNYDGCFESPLSIKILNDEADIVCTNPPFSKIHEYWDLLIKSKKKFIIISQESNCVTTYFIKYFQNKTLWAGFNDIRWFYTPKKELTRAAAFWFTNVKVTKRIKEKNLKIMKLNDIPEKYKKYDDNGILLVDYCYIPNDYSKKMAVSTTPILSGVLEKGFKIIDNKTYHPVFNGKSGFSRVLIQKI
jgi:predicted GIY-YIG superfamily endonuclease